MLYQNLTTVVLNKENFREKLFELIGPHDADLSGENGLEYVYESYIQLGYDSNLSYYIDDAIKKHSSLVDIVNAVLDDSKDFWASAYGCTDINIIELDDNLVVSLATSHS